jgi:hypothetical protein
VHSRGDSNLRALENSLTDLRTFTSDCANLAMTLANMNRRVLLVDGDIRSPRIHEVLGLENTRGVTDLLTQRPSEEGILDKVMQKTASPNLFVLTSGPAVPAGADLLFSTVMASVIERCREQFDMILIDTPPMLSMPDARVLGRISGSIAKGRVYPFECLARSAQHRSQLPPVERLLFEQEPTALLPIRGAHQHINAPA